MSASKRIEWLDAAKGIGILLVIFGHCLNMGGRPFHLIFTFHMPMFFLLSGYVFSGRDSFPTLLKKKARTLLVPFCGYYLLGLAVTLLLPQWRSGLTLAGIRNDLWLADPNAVHNSSIWFLMCLFFVVLLFWLLDKLPLWLQPLALTALYALGIWYGRAHVPFLGYTRLPLDLDVVPVAVVFFALGHYARRGQVMEKLTSKWQYELDAVLLGTAATVVVYQGNGLVNLHGMTFGNPVLYLAGGLSGSAAVIGASALVVRGTRGGAGAVKRVLLWYGRHSLMVLGLQSLLIRLYIVACGRFLGMELSLYQFPRTHSLISTFLVAFVACPVLCLLWDGAKRALRKKPEKEMV